MRDKEPARPADGDVRKLGALLKAVGEDLAARIEGARHGQHELREELRALQEKVSLLRAPEGPDPWFDKLCAALERLDARLLAGFEAGRAASETLAARLDALEARCGTLEDALRASGGETAARAEAAAESAKRELAEALERGREDAVRGLQDLAAKTAAQDEAGRLERQAMLEDIANVSGVLRGLVDGLAAEKDSRERGAAAFEGSLTGLREALRHTGEAVRGEGDRTAALVERLEASARERAGDQLRLAMLQVVEEVASVRKAIPQAADKEDLSFKLLELKQTLGFVIDATSKLGQRISDLSEVSERKRLMHRLDEVAKSIAALAKSRQDCTNP